MIAGIVFSLLSSIILNTGNVVQKHAVQAMPPFSPRKIGHLVQCLVSSPQWLLGFALCIVGIGLQVMAFALAPIPVVQSIFNAGIVLLLVLSRVRLRERLQPLEWFGIIVVLVSVTAIASSLTEATGSIGLSGTSFRVLLAAGPTLVVAAIVTVLVRQSRRARGFLYGLIAGLLYGVAALGTKGASTLVVRHGLLHSIPSVLTSDYPYVFVAFSLVGMLMYQTGLQRARISVVGTMSDAICSTYVVAIGMLVFGESLPKNNTTVLLRLGGFAGVLLGSILVAAGGRTDKEVWVPSTDADIGLGPILVPDVDGSHHLGGHKSV